MAKDLVIIAGSIEGISKHRNGLEIILSYVEIERLLDDIGIDAVMEHFELKQEKEDYGMRDSDFM
jgi:hypothetical protein